MLTDRLLSELERQDKYLKELPPNYEFPLFDAKQALESQRRNGYRDTAAAARELVDNAIEAGAKKIHVIFDKIQSKRGKRALVSSVAFIDDGSGMRPAMARYALILGGGTHFDDPDFIGKFGFGLPNASLNQTLRVEVYTRTNKSEPISMAALDVNDVKRHGLQTVDPTVERNLPEFVQRYMKENNINFEHGTVVVWVNPDRLTYRTAASLKEHLLDDFGVTYRYLLDQFELKVEGDKVEIVDPLFLDPRGRYYKPESEGGAILMDDRTLPVKFFRDPDTGALHLKKIEDAKELEGGQKDTEVLAVGSIHTRIARLPPIDFVGRDYASEEAKKRFEIRQSRRGMAFVRAGREIETVDAFPKSARDRASGLGNWPLLQSYAYNWGIEVRFTPELDEVFGITNDKQRVRPIEDFWRVLHNEEIDQLLRRENAWVSERREELKRLRQQQLGVPSEEPTPAEQAAAAVDTIFGRRSRIPESDLPQVQTEFEKEAQQRVGVTERSIEDARKALEAEAKRRPYRIDYFDDPNGAFYEPRWEKGGQIVVRINRQHPFYENTYGELFNLSGGARAKESVDALLIALAKSELTVDDEQAKQWYKVQRCSFWSPFLAEALKFLAKKLQPEEEEEQGNAELAAAG
ncbi:MAG TPA: ATP-binding protein [Pyrinomonadaceae bacterium]|jgi:hypothetical protein